MDQPNDHLVDYAAESITMKMVFAKFTH